MAKLRYYTQHPEAAQAIAEAGRAFAMRHHRTVSRMDQVLWTATLNRTRTMDLGRLQILRRPRSPVRRLLPRPKPQPNVSDPNRDPAKA